MTPRPLAHLVTLLALASSALGQEEFPHPPPASAPEIDVSLIGAAVALVLGGIFILTAVRRRKLARS